MGIIFSVIGAITGISGMIFAIIGLYLNRMAAVTSYLEYTRQPDFIEARNFVLDISSYDPKSIDKDSDKVYKFECILNTYNMIGLLVRKHQLPKWFFNETSTGDQIIRFYEILEPYVSYKREKYAMRNYANQFEYLYKLLKENI